MAANPVPNWREQLDDGIHYERGGSLDRALALYQTVVSGAGDPALISEALRRQSDVYRMRADWQDAIASATEAAEVAERAGYADLQADALNTEASTHFYRGEHELAEPLLERVLALTSNDTIRGAALLNLGALWARRGELDSAEQRFRQALECYLRAGHKRGEVQALQNLGAVALDREDYDLACTVMKNAVTAARHVYDLDLQAMTNVNYAEALAGKHEYPRAIDCASTAVGYFTTVNNKLWLVKCFRLLGDLYVKQGEIPTARLCYERGLRQAEEIDARPDAERIVARLQDLDS